MTYLLVGAIAAYLILAICYAINDFHDEYENTVENEGVGVGEFFAMTIVIGLLWPMFIIVFAIENLRGNR